MVSTRASTGPYILREEPITIEQLAGHALDRLQEGDKCVSNGVTFEDLRSLLAEDHSVFAQEDDFRKALVLLRSRGQITEEESLLRLTPLTN